MKIRIISGLPAEGVIYISAVVGAKADTADANVIKEYKCDLFRTGESKSFFENIFYAKNKLNEQLVNSFVKIN